MASKRQYQIVRDNGNDDIKVVSTSTRKRDIETAFNRWVRIVKESASFVTVHNQGYFTAEYHTEFHDWTTEYYIRAI